MKPLYRLTTMKCRPVVHADPKTLPCIVCDVQVPLTTPERIAAARLGLGYTVCDKCDEETRYIK